MNFECVCDDVAKIGESPVWSVAEQALYWIDIEQPALHRFEPESGNVHHWILPSEIGCFALYSRADRAIVGLRSGLYELQLADGKLRELATMPFDPLLFRFNEGSCDSTGRFWLGTMFDPRDASASPPPLKGQLHSYCQPDGLVAHPDFAVIPNGLGWDASSRTLYLAHSQDRTIYAFEFDAQAGQLGARRIFATVPQELGIPDGCALDEQGGYWSAIHGSGRLRRFHENGSFDHDVHLPVSLPTMCAFGGRELDTMYVTSKSLGLTPSQKRREPLAGKLLRFRPGVRGRPAATFRG
ncbi:MAG TPA: SMP-30/gluconolactonase/LRE family protein [Steroidobacteraceae bacterium]